MVKKTTSFNGGRTKRYCRISSNGSLCAQTRSKLYIFIITRNKTPKKHLTFVISNCESCFIQMYGICGINYGHFFVYQYCCVPHRTVGNRSELSLQERLIECIKTLYEQSLLDTDLLVLKLLKLFCLQETADIQCCTSKHKCKSSLEKQNKKNLK